MFAKTVIYYIFQDSLMKKKVMKMSVCNFHIVTLLILCDFSPAEIDRQIKSDVSKMAAEV